MQRTIENEFRRWKASASRKPLIISGARQVGKTWSCRAFGQEAYQRVLEINFQDDAAARTYFSQGRSIRDILTYLEINHIDTPLDSRTLIFFDEIQLVPELITSLKFFAEKCESDVICSGSMLGIAINGISSFPVGYVETLTMYPMSFGEYLEACRIPEKYRLAAEECVKERRKIPDALHERFNELFTQYLVCGGMPEAVTACLEEGIAGAVRVNRRLLHDLENDIAHYADARTRIKALDCFQSLPLQLAKDNKKFQYKLVREGYNARHFDESLAWLRNAGLIYQVHRLKKIGDPLEICKEIGVFKAYLFDTGILAANFPDSVISRILTETLDVYKGVFYENAAAQALAYLGRTGYYYEPNTSSEIDFVIETDNGIVPVEVKGGLHTRSTSFSNFVKNHTCRTAFRFSKKNVGQSDDGVTRYLPVYAMEWVL